MIGIRTDANKKIGMGHVMRCMTVAKKLRKLGELVIFFISDDYASDVIRNNGFECCVLSYEYKDKEAELLTFIDMLKNKKIKILLIDSYEVSEKYMSELNKEVKIAYIDDMNMFRYPADLIINYTYNAEKSLYKRWNYNYKTKFLLGSKYIPLRTEFEDVPVDNIQKVKRMLITTGGADEYDMLLDILHRLLRPRWEQFEKILIAGKFYEHIEDLRQIELQDQSVRVYYNISNMAEIMKQCQIAISAGGTTIAELCACGIPTIGFALADNQIYGLEAYSKDGIIKYVGDVRSGKVRVIDNIESNLEEFICDERLRKRQGEIAHNIIDGHGAMRIAQEIASL